MVVAMVGFCIRDHPLMTSNKLGTNLTPFPFHLTKLPVLLRPSYIVSQKCEPFTYLCDVIYEQHLDALKIGIEDLGLYH